METTTTARGFTSIYGNNDVDTFNFNQTTLTANTHVYEAKAARWRQEWPELTVLPWDGGNPGRPAAADV